MKNEKENNIIETWSGSLTSGMVPDFKDALTTTKNFRSVLQDEP